MKKFLCIILILCCSSIFLGFDCNQQATSTKSYTFTGKVIELYEQSCLLEVTDNGNQGFTVGDLVSVNTNVTDCPEYKIGDHLTITFDGVVAESYPMQIFSVENIKKTDANGNDLKAE